ncbi:MAG: protein kinase [bacterium]|nr:protein kinase [bacterium]
MPQPGEPGGDLTAHRTGEPDVAWGDLVSEAEAEGRRDVIESLRGIESIARFNHLLMSGGDPVATMSRPAVPADPTDDPGEPDALAIWRHLRLRRRVGRGASSDVFLALDPRLDREVALKLYRGETAGAAPDLPTGQHSLRASADLLREARLMARVKHPNVVSVHGAEHDGQRVGIWMDYIRGRTLSAVLREQGTLGAREAAIIGQDLCQALAAVHAAGVIHQDVKAQNVMREDGGRIVLMDFGVGLDVGTEAGASLFAPGGTPFYMAPETLLEGRSSPGSDVYSLGVLLFHLVSGTFPVLAEDLPQLLAAHKLGQRRLLRDLRPDLPREFVEVVERALARDPDARFRTMGEFENALIARPGGARVTEPARAKAPQRSRIGTWLTPVAILLASAIIAVAARSILNRTREPESLAPAVAIVDTMSPPISPTEPVQPGPVDRGDQSEPVDTARVRRHDSPPALPDLEIAVSPDFGTTATRFVFVAEEVAKPEVAQVARYRWSFDGADAETVLATGGPLERTFAAPGARTASLYAETADGRRTSPVHTVVNVVPTPVARVEVSPQAATTGDEFVFDATGSRAVGRASAGSPPVLRWDWNGDGDWDLSGSEAIVRQRFDTAGRHTVRLRVESADGLMHAEGHVDVEVRTAPIRHPREVIDDLLATLVAALRAEDSWTIRNRLFGRDVPSEDAEFLGEMFRNADDLSLRVQDKRLDFDGDGLTATVIVPLDYRQLPSRESRSLDLRLRFTAGDAGEWRLSSLGR